MNWVAAGIKKLPPGQPNYLVNESYRRFDQKYNMVCQGEWNPLMAHLSNKAMYESRAARARRGTPGYGLLDSAFYAALTANLAAADFSINVPDCGGTAWSPLDRSKAYRLVEEMGRWRGDPPAATGIIKNFARSVGAHDAGVCLLDRRWVYSHYYDPVSRESFPVHFSDEPGFESFTEPGTAGDKSKVIPAEMKYVIVFIHDMDRDGMATAPTFTQYATTYHAYSKVGYVTMAVAEFIRALGYNAIPSANDTAANIPLAIDAGLGELGRNAKLIHPVFGPRCRISKVITDLPLVPDAPISFGVTAFCDVCRKCAKKCPGKALSMGDRSYVPLGDFSCTGVLCWQADHARCREYWIKAGTSCGICINVCPFNKPAGLPHALVMSIVAKMPVLNRLIVFGDDLLGYGRPLPSSRFWEKFAGRG